MTRLVLANAIYFNASWLHPFDESATQDAPFHLLNRKVVNVPMMSMLKAGSLRYTQGEGYQVVELPYVGREVAMTIIMPDMDNFATLEAALNSDQLEAIDTAMRPRKVMLKLPKFSYESSLAMAETLAELGMPDAMGMNADFSGMDGTKDLFIGEVVHKAFVAVDEAGTEAAAATAVVMQLKMAQPAQPLQLTVDRPFIFLIRDLGTGSILFVGRVLNPGP